jgi:hypothetical protein
MVKGDHVRYFKDFFLTDSFLIRCHVSTGTWRLSTLLNSTDKPFIEVNSPTFISCTDGTQSSSDRALLRLSDILLAVELDAGEGDETLKSLSERGRKPTPVKIHVSSRMPLEVSGYMDSRISERTDLGPHDFIVIKDPKIHGLPLPVSEAHAFPDASPYVVVNRNRIALLFT